MTGKIKTLKALFGFISVAGDRSGDHFFHARDLRGVEFDDLEVGDEMSFESVSGDRGLRATNVTKL